MYSVAYFKKTQWENLNFKQMDLGVFIHIMRILPFVHHGVPFIHQISLVATCFIDAKTGSMLSSVVATSHMWL